MVNVAIREVGFDRFQDPRPELQEDSSLWRILLEVSHEANPNLYGALHGLRCIGTRLERSKQWGLVLKPILPGIGIGENITGWKDKEDYRAVAQEYLRPHHDLLLGLLKKIG